MGRTYKDREDRNHVAKELWSGKFPAKVIPDKRTKLSEDEILEQLRSEWGRVYEED